MATLGIDIGSSFSVMAAVGRGAINVVRNDISERLTPSLVGFTDRERLLGDPALTLFKSNFRNTCRNLKMLLGRVHPGDNSSSLADEQLFSYPNLVPAESGLVGFEVQLHGQPVAMSATAAMAALLSGLKAVAERSLEQPVVEAVIGVPSWYSDRNCQAMKDAAVIAGIPCLRLMSEHSAMALDYGIYRAAQFHVTEAHRVMFVSVGYATTTVSIADFVQNELRVVHVESDGFLGGRNMDQALCEHVVKGFNQRTNEDLLQHNKARMKVEDSAARTKKILSANQEAQIAIESVHAEEDLLAVVTRDEFTELCAPLRAKLSELLRKAFRKNDGASINAIELVGGCVRVPWVQECIIEVASEALGCEDSSMVPLSRTLNQDECIARGCALHAAMLSPRYKVRDFNVVDCVYHPVALSWDARSVAKEINVAGDAKDQEMQDAFAAPASPPSQSVVTKLLVPAGYPYPTHKWITFYPKLNILGIQLSYTEMDKLPASIPEVLGVYRIEVPNIAKAAEAKVKVEVRVDVNRQCILDAHLSQKVEVEKTVKEKRLKAVAQAPPNEEPIPDDPALSADGGPKSRTAAEEDKYEWVEVKQNKMETKRTVLRVTRDGQPGWLSDAQLKELCERELAMAHEDAQHRERKEKLNDLETYVYNMRDKVESSPLGDFFDPKVKVVFLQQLNAVGDWVYDEGETAQKSVLVAKLEELKAVGDKAVFLQRDKEQREIEASRFFATCSEFRRASASPDEVYAHIDPAAKQQIVDKANELEAWLRQQASLQVTLPLHHDPAFTASQMQKEIEEFAKKAHEILSTPKPEPPKADTPPPTEVAPPAEPVADATPAQA